MSLLKPDYLTDVHVGWNSNTQPAVLLKNTDTHTHILKWKNTDAYSKSLIHSAIMTYADKNKLSETDAKSIPPTGGWQTIHFNKLDLNAPTGLVADTNGYSTFVFKDPIVDLNTPTNLPSVEPISGSQVIKFNGMIKSISKLGLDRASDIATQGLCTIAYTKPINKTMVVVNEATETLVGLPLGSKVGFNLNLSDTKIPVTYTIKENDTLATINAEFNKSIKPSGCSIIINNEGMFVITNANFGSHSVVSVSDIDLETDIIPFFSVALINAVEGLGSAKIIAIQGKDSNTKMYKTSVKVDGVDNEVIIAGSEIPQNSFTSLIAVLNQKIPTALFAVDIFGQLKVTSKTTGEASSIVISEVPGITITTNDKNFNQQVLPLFSSINNFIEFDTPVAGSGYGVLTSTINNQIITITPTPEYTYAMLLDDVKKAITEEVIFDQYKITINSNDNNPITMEVDNIFCNIPNIVNITHNNGFKSQIEYHCTFNINNQLFDIIINNNECNNFKDLLNHLNELLDDVAVAEVINNDIIITSNTKDNTSMVKVKVDELFKYLTGFSNIGSSYSGITSMDDIFTVTSHNNQPLAQSLHGVLDIIPHKPTTKPKSKDDMYFNHNEKKWKYLMNDTEVK